MADSIQSIDVPCPGCEYNLRGRIVPTGVTVCPECGGAWKAAQLMMQEFAVPKYRCTYFLWALLPGALFAITYVLRELSRGTPVAYVVFVPFALVCFFASVAGPFLIAFLCWGALEPLQAEARNPAAFACWAAMIVVNIGIALAVVSMV